MGLGTVRNPVRRITPPRGRLAHHRPGVDLRTLRKEIHDASQIPFNLQEGPLVRVDLFARATDDQILLFTVHHIAADGWSLFLLLDDLRRIYPAERDYGAPPPPRPVRSLIAVITTLNQQVSSLQGQVGTFWPAPGH